MEKMTMKRKELVGRRTSLGRRRRTTTRTMSSTWRDRQRRTTTINNRWTGNLFLLRKCLLLPPKNSSNPLSNPISSPIYPKRKLSFSLTSQVESLPFLQHPLLLLPNPIPKAKEKPKPSSLHQHWRYLLRRTKRESRRWWSC